MTDSAQPPEFALDGPVSIDNTTPANTSGAFCDLFTGIHAIAGKVALKRPRGSSYSETLMRQIQTEAAVWVKLDHPRILKFLGIYTVDETIYLVSPFAENGSLPSYLENFPQADRGRLVVEIAEGLAYLHQFEPGIIHGDVKGNNVLIPSDHRPRLCDFGLARHVDARTATSLKGAGSVPWQSPEVLRDEASKSFQTDVYAFGITIYEVLSGRIPYFDYPSIGSMIAGVLFAGVRPPMEPASAPNDISYSRIWAEAARCWSDDPAERPSMVDVLLNLSDLQTEPKIKDDQMASPSRTENNSPSLRKNAANAGSGELARTPSIFNAICTPKRKAEDSAISDLRSLKKQRLSWPQPRTPLVKSRGAVPEIRSPFPVTPVARPEVPSTPLHETLLPEDRDTDLKISNDLSPTNEYSEDIYEHLQDLEKNRMPRQSFMDALPEQAWRARGRVVDWLLLLHRQLELLSETFWMAINLFDRLLSIRNIPVARYQFTGLVCASLATKSQESIPRRINWWELSSDDGDNAEKFLAGELAACQQLEWRLECPNPLAFLRRISVVDGSDTISFRLAKYLVLMQCFDPHLLEYRPSLIAASAYWLTRISLKQFDWPEILCNATGYGRDELFPPATCMVRYLCNPVKLENFFYLFASTPRLKASEFFYDWARSNWEEGSRLNAGLKAELPFLKETTDDSWRELYPFEEWIVHEQ